MMITIAAIITILVNWVALAICVPISKRIMKPRSWKIYRAYAIIVNLITTTFEVVIVVNQ